MMATETAQSTAAPPVAEIPASNPRPDSLTIIAPALALGPMNAAKALDVGWDLFHAEIEPELKCVRVRSKKLFPVKELQRWLDENAGMTL